MTEDLPFNRQLRKATRDIHSVSDALVNAKLVFALSDDQVWGESLLVFYEIFRFLEEAMLRNKGKHLGEMFIEGMERTMAFEEDLKFYLGKDWKADYEIRESVQKYINHLEYLEKENSDFLTAYVYHLYMGLLSGGQIIRRKKMLVDKIRPLQSNENKGYAVTDFGNINISSLKKEIVEKINSIAEKLDDKTKNDLLIESKKVFELNNEIVRSIQVTNFFFTKKYIAAILLVIVAYLIFLNIK